jgi:AAA-like domain
MALLGVEASEEHKAVLRGLGNGECVFRDLEGRVGRIGIDLISDEMRRWLDTNPTRARPAEGSVSPDGDPAQGAGLLGATPPGEPAR